MIEGTPLGAHPSSRHVKTTQAMMHGTIHLSYDAAANSQAAWAAFRTSHSHFLEHLDPDAPLYPLPAAFVDALATNDGRWTGIAAEAVAAEAALRALCENFHARLGGAAGPCSATTFRGHFRGFRKMLVNDLAGPRPKSASLKWRRGSGFSGSSDQGLCGVAKLRA
jgi:hypothetical protein